MSAALWITLGVVMILVALGGLVLGVGMGAIDGEWRFAVLGAAVLLISIPVACKSFIAASRSINETSCASFADQTGYETKVIITNAFDSGGCFVNFDGRWVPRGQLWAELRDGATS